uniref:energy-coupling factor transporter ATPase n=1 Tax=Ndongobacter massiliensis TaxID=1871025 RepID=UPI0009315CD8|nr:energy-coupling factor transporter ATPase [Ndongobacter massiliensis]
MSIRFENVTFYYGRDNKHPLKALDGVNLEIQAHEYIGLIGHTGSGKSTLVQHMNGLNLPHEGHVIVDGIDTTAEKADLRTLRQKVGLVFQYPEDQLFEETVAQDIAFGPKNLGLSPEEVEERVRSSMEAVGLSYERFKDTSPFDLSGGQKRRVAIAGVLALQPSYLVLDEPTAGLDPRGREEILGELRALYEARPEMTIVLVTHSMEDIAAHATRIFVVDHGKIVMDGAPREIFAREEELERIGLSVPEVTRFLRAYRRAGHEVDDRALTVEEAFNTLYAYLTSREGKEPSCPNA